MPIRTVMFSIPGVPRLNTRRNERRSRIAGFVTAFVSVFVSALFAIVAVTGVPAQAAEAEDEAAFVTKINQLRAGLGLPTLAIDTELVAASRIWAIQLRSDGELSHASDLSVGVSSDWAKLGENVGVADTNQLNELFDAFVASPGHYANLVDPTFTHVGTAVVYDSNGRMWTTHRFMDKIEATTSTTDQQPQSTTSTSVSPPASTTTTTTGPSSLSTTTTTTPTTVPDSTTTTTEAEADSVFELVTSPAHAPLQAIPTRQLDQGIVAELVRALSS